MPCVLTIGRIRILISEALDLDLTRSQSQKAELRSIDAATALQEALAQRPEFKDDALCPGQRRLPVFA